MIYGGIFDIEGKDKKVKDLETISEKGDFWDNQQEARKVSHSISAGFITISTSSGGCG